MVVPGQMGVQEPMEDLGQMEVPEPREVLGLMEVQGLEDLEGPGGITIREEVRGVFREALEISREDKDADLVVLAVHPVVKADLVVLIQDQCYD